MKTWTIIGSLLLLTSPLLGEDWPDLCPSPEYVRETVKAPNAPTEICFTVPYDPMIMYFRLRRSQTPSGSWDIYKKITMDRAVRTQVTGPPAYDLYKVTYTFPAPAQLAQWRFYVTTVRMEANNVAKESLGSQQLGVEVKAP